MSQMIIFGILVLISTIIPVNNAPMTKESDSKICKATCFWGDISCWKLPALWICQGIDKKQSVIWHEHQNCSTWHNVIKNNYYILAESHYGLMFSVMDFKFSRITYWTACTKEMKNKIQWQWSVELLLNTNLNITFHSPEPSL